MRKSLIIHIIVYCCLRPRACVATCRAARSWARRSRWSASAPRTSPSRCSMSTYKDSPHPLTRQYLNIIVFHICALNKTIENFNDYIHISILGSGSPVPVPWDIITICLTVKNNIVRKSAFKKVKSR